MFHSNAPSDDKCAAERIMIATTVTSLDDIFVPDLHLVNVNTRQAARGAHARKQISLSEEAAVTGTS